MQKANCFLYNKQIKDLAKKGEPLLKDLPHLPKDWVKNIVKILPILVLIGGIFSLFSGIESLLAFNRRGWIMNWMQISRAYYYVTAGFSILMGILYLMAYKLIKNKEYEGWLLLFWASILSLVQSIVLLILGWGGLFGSLVAAAIGFYLLYEIRSEFIATKTDKTTDSKKNKNK